MTNSRLASGRSPNSRAAPARESFGTNVQSGCPPFDQLGTSAGIAGSLRFLMASIASTIYTVVLNSELTKKVAPRVGSAVIAAGLPSGSVSAFVSALSVGSDALNAVDGVTPDIIAIGSRAYKEANAAAYKIVFLTTIAFSALCVTCALLLPDMDRLLTNKVATSK